MSDVMLPKDLLADLESGDRTSEHLEVKELQFGTYTLMPEQLQGLQNALQRVGTNAFAQSANQMWQGGLTGTSTLGQLGGITRW